jgi:hypothetical protein
MGALLGLIGIVFTFILWISDHQATDRSGQVLADISDRLALLSARATSEEAAYLAAIGSALERMNMPGHLSPRGPNDGVYDYRTHRRFGDGLEFATHLRVDEQLDVYPSPPALVYRQLVFTFLRPDRAPGVPEQITLRTQGLPEEFSVEPGVERISLWGVLIELNVAGLRVSDLQSSQGTRTVVVEFRGGRDRGSARVPLFPAQAVPSNPGVKSDGAARPSSAP